MSNSEAVVTDDWVIVPREPTADMVTDGRVVMWQVEECETVQDLGNLFRKQWAQALAAAPVSPQPLLDAPRVKALEWTSVGRRGKHIYRAETPFGDYQVDCYEDSDGSGWEAFYGDTHELGCFANEPKAKAAAQADYEQRIRSALQSDGEGK